LRSVPTYFCGISEKGFSSSRSTAGTKSATPMRASTMMTAQRSTSCGRPSSESSADPIRVTRLKLVTSPRITR